MSREFYRKLAGISSIFAISIVLFIGVYSQSIPNPSSPPPKQGVLDLSDWDFRGSGLVRLDGEWEFYEDQLLEPLDFRQGTRPEPAYLSVPGTWKGKLADSGMTRKGYGTYRLKVIVPVTDEVFGLKMRSVRMSHRLFINGKPEGESGLPAAGIDEYRPGNTPYTTFFHTGSREVEIVIQVSNHVFVTGGIVNSIPFGLHHAMTKMNGIQLGTDIAMILILGMFGSYHLSLYFIGRRERSYLLSGFYMLILVVQKSLFGEKILQRTLPDLPFEIAYKLLDVSEFLSAAVIILFFCTVDPRLMSPRRRKAVLAPLAVYVAAVVVLPYHEHIQAKYLFYVYLGIAILCIIGRMIYLYGKSGGLSSERREQALFIGGIVSLLLFLVDGSLYAENLVPTDLAGKFGVISFIIFMNILLAVRFSNAYAKTESLTHQLTISNQLKDEFLTNTSHEIKTPLHGIMNMTSYLLDDEENNLTAKQKQNLWLIKDTSMKLSMLIHDLIDVTRLKHGELRLQQTVVDVKVAAQIVCDVLQFELAGKAVRLVNQVDSDVWVLADENRLRQVLYNLVHNAIKHTDQGTIEITATVENETVYLHVEDTGTGIPPERRDAIFEYFEQLDGLLPQDGYTGMGVGLYISRKLVERMGGDIRVAWSEVGRGTSIVFTLPAVKRIPVYREAASAYEELRRVAFDDAPLDIVNQQGDTILIVDDEASNIHSLLTILKRHRYNVVVAFSAKEAMDKMKQHPDVDLVILDVMMPGTSGIELCQTLRTHYSILDLPILFATAKDTTQDIALGFRAGANDYVTKPFDGETLIARIQTLIAMKTSIQEAIRNEHAFHQAQIKPHFLYNALSSVISFCYTDGEKAAYLLTMLSQYLRYILDMDRSTLFVPLYRELELIEAYVEIEKARFGERFDFVCTSDPKLNRIEIPSLCIQPFVENAIRHGLFEKEGPGKVTLAIREVEGYIQVTIEDDGVGIPDDLLYHLSAGERKTGGIGISNIRKRLDTIPGAALTIRSEPGLGTKVMMYLPAS
ncbi:hybrid sensor histidine kinase/response regulator [Paenibacillus oceani]|uniref:histidine kinase n=1 Tax=Paenibacillus oceani TaxID=2772510 RepID=A0A927C7F8_9BACL|nr:ATP-binding protein [Paenibacillus oceani]MBD2862254.1 response regulator [Paenibacillus oceani]